MAKWYRGGLRGAADSAHDRPRVQRRKLDDSFLEDDLLSVYGANQNAITNAATKVAKRMKEMVTE